MAEAAGTGRGTQADATVSGPGAPAPVGAPEVTAFVGRTGGVEVTVGVWLEPVVGQSAVLLGLAHEGAPTREAIADLRLGPGEAHRLAAALSAAAYAAVGRTPLGTVPTDAGTPDHVRPEGGFDEIIAVEGTAAADLAAALVLLPDGAVLTDFSADAEVSLIFSPPAAPVSTFDPTATGDPGAGTPQRALAAAAAAV